MKLNILGHKTANINLLLKPGKGPTLPASYRPMSLINDDLKIKTLAKRLEPVTPNVYRVHQRSTLSQQDSEQHNQLLYY